MYIRNDQASRWILDIRDNLRKFRLEQKTADEELEYIKQQYEILYQLSRAIDGKVRFVGVPRLE